MRIPISKPLFGPEEMLAVQEPLRTGWVVQGPHVARFEQKFSEYTGAAYASATTSCTTALHLAVSALGLTPGDEVIVPAFTWIATANVVEYLGAKPIFCDIDLHTYNLDTARLDSCITPRTVGIIPVHLFGLCADMDPILQLAARHHLWVVEDAACAFGAWYAGRHAGTFGAAGCFSFHPRKSISTGEGGMITTADPELDKVCRSLRDHGASISDLARHSAKGGFALPEFRRLGYNFRMTDLQGAVGCAQMDRAEDILKARRRRAARYDELLAGLDWLQIPQVPSRCTHGYQAYVTLFRPEKPDPGNVERLHDWRNGLMQRLEAAGVATRQGTHAPVLLHYYADKYRLRPEQFPMAYLADRLSLALPLFAQMTDEEQDWVCRHLQEEFDARIAA